MSSELNALVEVVKRHFVGNAEREIEALSIKVAQLQRLVSTGDASKVKELAIQVEESTMRNDSLRGEVARLQQLVDNHASELRLGEAMIERLKEIQGGKDRQVTIMRKHMTAAQVKAADAELDALKRASKRAARKVINEATTATQAAKKDKNFDELMDDFNNAPYKPIGTTTNVETKGPDQLEREHAAKIAGITDLVNGMQKKGPEMRPITPTHVVGRGGLLLSAADQREWDRN